MNEYGFSKSQTNHYVFTKRYADDHFLIFLLYVDDILIVGKNSGRIAGLKNTLSKSFAMKDLEPTKKILSIEIIRDKSNKLVCLSQEKYLEKVLERFNMHKVKSVNALLGGHFNLSTKQRSTTKKEREAMRNVSYQSIGGSLCMRTCTQPGLAHAVSIIS